MLWIHVFSGSLAILAGFLALSALKGGRLHVLSGRTFVGAMFTMTISAVLIALFLRPNLGNVIAAAATLYLVATGWLAARAGVTARRSHIALATLAFGVGVFDLALCRLAWQAPTRSVDGIPAPALLMFASVMLFGALGDARWLRRDLPSRPARVLRHLWRMSFALWVATMSLFLGQADEFPQPVRSSGILFVPVLWVTGVSLYWLAKQSWAVLRARIRRAQVAGAGMSDSAG